MCKPVRDLLIHTVNSTAVLRSRAVHFLHCYVDFELLYYHVFNMLLINRVAMSYSFIHDRWSITSGSHHKDVLK